MVINLNWEAIINKRRSTRSFELTAISEEERRQLTEFIGNMEIPFEHTVESRFFKGEPNKKLYTVYDAPTDNLAFITETDYVSISKAGFVGELVILYATALGLSTCWYGHYTLMELEKNMPHLGQYKNQKNPKWGYGKDVVDGRRAIAVTPIAYWKNKGLRVIDRIQLGTVSYKRKELTDLLVGETTYEKLSDDLKYVLDLARKAPSAGNGQFWRYEVSKDQKQIKIYIPIGYKHPKWEHPNVEPGITACHVWLGLKMKDIPCTIDVYEDKKTKRAIWQFDLQ